jgi:hypothetical protein
LPPWKPSPSAEPPTSPEPPPWKLPGRGKPARDDDGGDLSRAGGFSTALGQLGPAASRSLQSEPSARSRPAHSSPGVMMILAPPPLRAGVVVARKVLESLNLGGCSRPNPPRHARSCSPRPPGLAGSASRLRPRVADLQAGPPRPCEGRFAPTCGAWSCCRLISRCCRRGPRSGGMTVPPCSPSRPPSPPAAERRLYGQHRPPRTCDTGCGWALCYAPRPDAAGLPLSV